MRIWAKVIENQKIVREAVQEFSSARPLDAREWVPIVASLCKPLDLACPVILQKHVLELRSFSRTVFSPADFIEGVSFDRFEMEIFPEKKRKPARDGYGEEAPT